METQKRTSHPHLIVMLSRTPGVVDLELHRVDFHHGDRLFDIIYAFPKLRSLTLTSYHWVQSLSPSTLMRKWNGPPLHLQKLELIGRECAKQIVTSGLSQKKILLVYAT